jgi:hypothetical protein
MRGLKLAVGLGAAASLLAGCAGGGLNRNGPDEFAVARNAPLVVPPDFALAPPQPGAASPAASDSRTQAIQALFGGPAARSSSENGVLSQAESDRAAPGARSVAGDPGTNVVDKGNVTQTILAVPEGNGQEASVSTPQ